eukprot:CAMPEP_0197442724 /NCGR_PEP_ID=MMETSP1175-20131217/8679_1 /TAXON_ID=1003142 /ORGANISM="Triceratium dubium, Strain CCMP147" /LENGTH=84 /DNA_ID=CAMNT_0042973253 /DNA_START=92 /DNA_END=347 /DNA_ORIENTATION=-
MTSTPRKANKGASPRRRSPRNHKDDGRFKGMTAAGQNGEQFKIGRYGGAYRKSNKRAPNALTPASRVTSLGGSEDRESARQDYQ